MKSRMLLLIVLLTSFSVAFGGFEKVIEGFDEEITDTLYLWYENAEHANLDSNYIDLTWVDSPVYAGEKAVKVDYKVQNSESWGGYAKIYLQHPDSTKCFDFTGYDTLSLMYYNEVPQQESGRITFRINLLDVSDAARGDTAVAATEGEYYYSFHTALDAEPGWNEIKLALESLDANDGTAFNLTGWSGINGNAFLDKDKIKSVHFEFSISTGAAAGSGDTDGGIIYLDHLALKGASKVDLVLFNGKALPSSVTLEQPWDGSATITDEVDSDPEGLTSAIQWNAGAQWSGPLFRLSKPSNLHVSWMTDSLQFKIKGEAGTGNIQVKFADTDEGEGDFPFEATYDIPASDIGFDGTWKTIKVALADFNRNAGVWVTDHTEPGVMDSSKVAMFGVLVADANSAGKTIYLDDIWTGNPSFDLFAPEAPQGVSGQPNPEKYYNLVFWQDVEGESGEVYNVYASGSPITDVNDPNVELIAENVLEGVQTVAHYLQYPLVDGEVDFYYAVECKDAAGNVGEATFSEKVTGMAKGIPTISDTPPAGFAVDGYFDEWYDAGIRPWVLKPEVNNVPVGSFTDSTDLKATIWLAVDNDYLYVAGEVIDDVYNFGAGDWWNQDAFEFFIGFYNLIGSPHSSNRRGSQPDYKFQFHENGVVNEYNGNTVMNGEDVFFIEGFNPDWVFEAKLPLDQIPAEDDKRFEPKRGMRIPLELYLHDNDGTENTMDGALAWSDKNEDNAHSTPSVWSYTWIGDTTHVATAIDDNNETIVTKFSLEQNYPNPFNPTTTINYSIGNAELVKIGVYNLLGQRIAELVNNHQKAGVYKVQWDATHFSSGMYFYRLEAGSFVSTKKMLLMK